MQQKVLVDLVAMQVDAPTNFKFDFAHAAHILVDADFLPINEFVVADGAGVAVEDIIDEAFDLN